MRKISKKRVGGKTEQVVNRKWINISTWADRGKKITVEFSKRKIFGDSRESKQIY